MPHPTARPSDDDLRRFLLGTLPPDAAATVAEWLASDPTAVGTLREVQAGDSFTGLVAQAARFDPSAADESPHTAPPGVGRSTISGPDTPPDQQPAPAADVDDPFAGLLAPPQTPDEMGRLDGYRVLRLLGRGGMGAVFQAEDIRLGRRVALKVMLPAVAANPTAGKRFLQEARTAAAVEHDYIVPIWHVGEDRGVPFLAMPLLLGETLDEPLRGHRSLAIPDVLLIGRQIAEGLAAAHEQGLVHRDVKPSNVWLERTRDGTFRRVRILDFGLAKPVSAAGGEALTHSGAILGTPSYMAPEQARGKPVDARADLFSLGCVLYRMATGKLPFPGSDTFAVLSAIAMDTPPAPSAVNPAVPAALSDLIERLLSKDPAGRPRSAREVADELTRIATGLAIGPVPVSATQIAVGAASPADVWENVAANATEREYTPKRAAASDGRGVNRGLWWTVAALLVLPLGLLAYYSGTVIRVVTNQGELVIEVDDPTIEVKVTHGGAELTDKTRKRTFVLKAGQGGEVQFLDPDTGATAFTRKFQIVRGDKTVVTATMADIADARKTPKPKPATAADPDRKAADWAFQVASATSVVIRLPDRPRKINSIADLPSEPFQVIEINFESSHGIEKTSLELLRELSHLTRLSFNNSSTYDGHLRALEGNTTIESLDLRHTGISDTGLNHVKTMKALEHLKLIGTAVTDTGLRQLEQLTKLKSIELQKTKVTEAGVKKLAAALPQCMIRWDGVEIEPTASPAPRLPVAGSPPARDAFSGKLIFYDTFDDPKASTLFVGTHTELESTVANGVYASSHPAARPGRGLFQDVPPGTPDAAFVVRVRATNATTGIGFRNRLSATRGDWLEVNILPDGRWSLLRKHNLVRNGQIEQTGSVIAEAAAADPMLGAGQWVTIAAQAVGNTYELWINGKSVARGIDDKADFAGLNNHPAALQIGGYAAVAARARVEFDYVAVWDLSAAVATPDRYKNALGMEFARVPKGKSWLGGGGGTPGDKEVEFKDDFYLGVYTVTQEEWEKVMGSNPAHYSRLGFRKEAVKDIPDAELKRFPVEGVSYADVQSFLTKLNERDKQAGWEYRLPTEAEWEYACRGGPLGDRTDSAFHFYTDKPSNHLPPDRANYAHKGGPNRTIKVGQHAPNKLGLYDMHGNVLEWCSDPGRSPEGEETRAARGGSWNDFAGTAARRIPFLPRVRYPSLGLRVARVPVKPSP